MGCLKHHTCRALKSPTLRSLGRPVRLALLPIIELVTLAWRTVAALWMMEFDTRESSMLAPPLSDTCGPTTELVITAPSPMYTGSMSTELVILAESATSFSPRSLRYSR